MGPDFKVYDFHRGEHVPLTDERLNELVLAEQCWGYAQEVLRVIVDPGADLPNHILRLRQMLTPPATWQVSK